MKLYLKKYQLIFGICLLLAGTGVQIYSSTLEVDIFRVDLIGLA